MRKISGPLAWLTIISASVTAIALVLYHNGEFYQSYEPLPTVPIRSTKTLPQNARIEISLGGGHRRLFEARLEERTYALRTALEAAAQDNGFRIDFSGDRIRGIAGVTGSWRIYRGDKTVGTSLSSLTIKAGDHYRIAKE